MKVFYHENRFRVQRFRGSRLGNSRRVASETKCLKAFSSAGAKKPVVMSSYHEKN
jgi:hypothetical protein